MTLPSNPVAEQCVLSICSQRPEKILDVEPDRFFNPTHSEIFEALKTLHLSGCPTDLNSVTMHFHSKGGLEHVGGAFYLTECLLKAEGGHSSFPYYFGILESTAAYRRFITSSLNAIEKAKLMTDPLDGLVESVVASALTGTLTELPKIESQLSTLLNQLEDKTPTEFFHFGIAGLDRALRGGALRTEFVNIAAATSKGKSILLGMLAAEGIKRSKKVAYFSLEMPKEEVLKRFLSNFCGFEVRPLQDAPWSNHQCRSIMKEIGDMSGKPFWLFDNESNLNRILVLAEKIHRTHGLDLLVIDYIQRLDEDGDSREESISRACRKMKSFAMRNNCVVASASQINDNGQLFASRTIGHESNILVQADDEKLTIIKNRRGPNGIIIPVVRMGELGRFEEAPDSTDF